MPGRDTAQPSPSSSRRRDVSSRSTAWEMPRPCPGSSGSVSTAGPATSSRRSAAGAIVRVAGTDLRVWFFTLAFVCIGLEFRPSAIREAGVRPLLVFGAATILNLIVALALATILFTGFALD